MDLTREYIDGLSFTVKKDKYYLGYEVDQALDDIAEGVDELQGLIAEYRLREEKMAKAILHYQNLEKQRQAEGQAQSEDKTKLAAAMAQISLLRQQIQQLQQQPPVAAAPAAPVMDDERLRLAAQAERSLAEFKATREHLLEELTALQSRKDALQQEIGAIAAQAAEHILALTKE